MHRIPAIPLSEVSELSHCSVLFVPGDPARGGRMAFWRPDGTEPPSVVGGAFEEVDVAVPGGEDIELSTVPAVLLPMRAALPVLTRARAASGSHPTAAFWGAAGVLALQLAARGLLLPGLTPGDHDSWRAGPLGTADLQRLRELAAAMPPA
ncbi:ATP-dependent helicase, partial [Streptomyces sp. NPDC005904]